MLIFVLDVSCDSKSLWLLRYQTLPPLLMSTKRPMILNRFDCVAEIAAPAATRPASDADAVNFVIFDDSFRVSARTSE